MSDPREMLRNLVSSVEADPAIKRAFAELCYTASEGGLLPFALHGEEASTVLALVALAHTHKNGVPSELRV